jgi:iron complex transport system ATP-binding protein
MKLSLENLSVERRGRPLLDRVSLEVEPGELLAVLGPNGAGKTTLLRAVLGIVAPTNGGTRLGGDDVRSLAPRQRAARVAWLPQHGSRAEELTALEVVMAGRFRFDEPYGQSEREAAKALERVNVAGVAQQPLGSLSGGERQRVALATLLAQSAPVLLVDEPGNHLDPAQQIEVYRLIGQLWAEGASVVCVTHDVNLLRHLGEPNRVRVVGLSAGSVRFECRLDAPELPQRLGELFSVQMHELSLNGARVLLPEKRA